MKIYDKEIYKKSEAIKPIFIILFIFLFGFGLGYFINNYEDKIINQAIELDSLRETVYIYQMQEKTK